MNVNYRNLAHQHLKNSEKQLNKNSEESLKYAALELRMSIEALTYDRALAYKDEFPPSEYETWQPRKLMAVLLEIDPLADTGGTLSIGQQKEQGKPAPKMTSLGIEKVFGMKLLKKHYDALGSFLHILSIKQAHSGNVVDYMKIRARNEVVAKFVNEVLSSSVFNVTLGSHAKMNCMNCGNSIHRRLPAGQKETEAECLECNASYTIFDEGNGKVKWIPHQEEIICQNEVCQVKTYVWNREIEPGKHWKCSGCGGKNTIVLAIQHEAKST